jgi:carotenoid cleavage dioxygenase-like enzyme
LRESFEWDSEKLTNIYVLDKNTGKVIPIKFQADPFFTFHHANTYEQDGCLIVDYCKYQRPETFGFLSLQELRNGAIALEAVSYKV